MDLKMKRKGMRLFMRHFYILAFCIVATACGGLNQYDGMFGPMDVEIAEPLMFRSDSGDYWHVVGQVRNFEGRAVQDILIGTMLYDANNDVVCSSFVGTDVEILNPGNTSDFAKTFSVNECPGVKSVKTQIDADWAD
jgi:hypothetical protein